MHTNWSNLHDAVRMYEYGLFKKSINDYSSILEVGIGEGFLTGIFLNEFKKVVSVDNDKSVVSYIGQKFKKYSNLHLIDDSFENIGNHSIVKEVKNIFLGHVMEHVYDPVLSLKVLKRHCDKDALIYLSVPNALSLHRLAAVQMGLLKTCYDLTEQDQKLGHKRQYDMTRFKSDLVSSGLSIVESGGIFVKPLSNSQIEKYYSRDMIKAFLSISNILKENCGEIYAICTIS